MLQGPTVVNEHQRPIEAASHITDPSKYKGGAIFLVKGFKTEKQRIAEHLSSNEFLDLSPAFSRPCFREEDRSKDINPRMYYTPKSTMERIRAAARYANFVLFPQLDQGESAPKDYLQKGDEDEEG